MGIFLDIAGMLLVRATIIVIMVTVTVTMNDVLYFKIAKNSVQSDLHATIEVLESDIRNAGYGVTVGTTFKNTDTLSLLFLADIDTNGTPDLIYYYLSDTSFLAASPNPNDKLLYRQVNNGLKQTVGVGVTQFQVHYYTLLGDPTTDTLLVGSLEIQMDVEHGYLKSRYSPNINGDWFPAAHWRRRLFPTI